VSTEFPVSRSPGESPRATPGIRRNAITAVASAVAAVALAVAVAGRSCQVEDDTPQAAVREFAAAAAADDREALYRIFGPETRQRLDAAAKRATDLVGGSERYSPLAMISVGRSRDLPLAKDFVVKERSESRALVEIVGPMGDRAEVTVVRVDGRWHIELPSYGR
jgi:hypothetical protein